MPRSLTIWFDHPFSGSLQQAGDGKSQQVVADVSQVQGLVGIGRGVFHHHRRRFRVGRAASEVLCAIRGRKLVDKNILREFDVQETFHDVESTHHVGDPLHQRFADLPGGLFGGFVRSLRVGEYQQGYVAGKFFAGGLEVDPGIGEAVERIQHLGYVFFEYRKNVHKTVVSFVYDVFFCGERAFCARGQR